MITYGTNTVESLQHITNLLVVPRLFEEPAEGAVAWLQNNVPDPKPIRKDTIPDRIIRAEFEARYYSLLLSRILTGEYEQELLLPHLAENDRTVSNIDETDRPESLERIASLKNLPLALQWAATAKRYRLLFDRGRPLFIGVYGGEERYQQALPVLTYTGYGQYVAGGPALYKQFAAISHAAALRTAQQWFFKQREQEVEAAKKEAGKVRDAAPPIVIDLLTAVLEQDGIIVDEMGTRLAWKNGGIHGRFGVTAPRWMYLLTCAPQTAIYLMLLSINEAMEADLYAPLQLEHIQGNVYQYLNFKKDGDNLVYADGVVKPHPQQAGMFGVFREGMEKPHMVVSVNGEIEVSIVGVGGKPERIIQSPIPKNILQISDPDCAAWAAWAGLKISRKRN